MAGVDLEWPDQRRLRGFRAPIVKLWNSPSVVRHDLANHFQLLFSRYDASEQSTNKQYNGRNQAS
jgi:hypothetical protein